MPGIWSFCVCVSVCMDGFLSSSVQGQVKISCTRLGVNTLMNLCSGLGGFTTIVSPYMNPNFKLKY